MNAFYNSSTLCGLFIFPLWDVGLGCYILSWAGNVFNQLVLHHVSPFKFIYVSLNFLVLVV
jgi:hypothetical protein